MRLPPVLAAGTECRRVLPDGVVRLIRDHIKEFGAAEDGRLFRAVRNGGLLSKEYGDIWKAARLSVLTKQEAKTPLAEVPYGLRAACVSLWLESGVSPAEVARRAGHSIAVLFRFYAKAVRRNQHHANQQIERALAEVEASNSAHPELESEGYRTMVPLLLGSTDKNCALEHLPVPAHAALSSRP